MYFPASEKLSNIPFNFSLPNRSLCLFYLLIPFYSQSWISDYTSGMRGLPTKCLILLMIVGGERTVNKTPNKGGGLLGTLSDEKRRILGSLFADICFLVSLLPLFEFRLHVVMHQPLMEIDILSLYRILLGISILFYFFFFFSFFPFLS